MFDALSTRPRLAQLNNVFISKFIYEYNNEVKAIKPYLALNQVQI